MSITLFKSSTCPQCKVVQMKLDKKKIPYAAVYVDDMDTAELAEEGIKGIPTLIVDGEKMTNVRVISKWIDAQEVNNG